MATSTADIRKWDPTRQFLAFFLPAALIVCIGAWLVARASIATDESVVLQREIEQVKLAKSSLLYELTPPIDQIRSLVREGMVREVYQGPQGTSTQPMENAFQTLLSRNPGYRSVRWIGEDGEERVKAENVDGKEVIAPASDLQNKKNRYFFKEAVSVPAGQVYISPMDLFVDLDKIVVPYVPTYRIAERVFDRAGRPNGIIIINIFASRSIERFLRSAEPIRDRLFLLNGDGYWLRNPDPRLQWGFMFGRNDTLGTQFREAWQAISSEPEGQRRDQDGIWTWDTITLKNILPGMTTSTETWKVVSHMPPQTLAGIASRVWWPIAAYTLMLLALIGAGVRQLVTLTEQKNAARLKAFGTEEQARRLQDQQEAQKNFQVVFEANASRLMVVDSTGTITQANAALLRMFGYGLGELIGQSAGTLVPDTFKHYHSTLVSEFFSRPVSQKMGNRGVISGRRRDGKLFPVEIGLSHFINDGMHFALANVIDLTDHQRAEKLELYRNQVLQRVVDGDALEDILESITLGIETLDPAALCSILVLDREGKHLLKGAAPHLPDFYNAAIDGIDIGEGQGSCGTAAFTGQRTIVESIQTHPYWTAFLDLANRAGLKACWSEPIRDSAQKVIGTFAIYHTYECAPSEGDVQLIVQASTLASIAIERSRTEAALETYRNHLEELVETRTAELAEAKKLAELASQSKSAFLANMSHEIRTPMNAIIGLTHLLQRESLAPQHQERLAKIDGAGRHLLAILDDILDLSKIEADKLQLEVTEFHLSAILDNVRSIIGEQAGRKGLTVEVDPDHVPAWLRGDPTRLRQALLNFAGNAVKFTNHGKIVLRSQLVDETDHDLVVRFEVEDTGIGISEDKRQHLFQSFEQGDVSTTRRYGGTGLGLAITRRLATLMGGEVGVRSVVGEGSTFWFTARLARGDGKLSSIDDVAASDAAAKLRARGVATRLLIAEDNEINREVALELLHAVGLDADTAVDGRQAIEMARANRYDLILMDMQMPEVDGLDATRTILALPDRRSVTILAMTANVFEEDIRNCHQAGMKDVIGKPVDPETFYVKLLAWLPEAPVSARTANGAAPAHAAQEEEPAAASLPELPGIDTAVGLTYAMGRRKFYESLLLRFRDAHAARFVSDFRTASTAGDWPTATRLAHTLKGLARTIGAGQLGQILESLEHAATAHSYEDATRIAAEAKCEIARVRQGLDQIETAPHNDVAPRTEPPDLPLTLARLRKLLDERDTAALRMLDLLSDDAMQVGCDDALVRQICDEVRRFDYASASRQLEALAAAAASMVQGDT